MNFKKIALASAIATIPVGAYALEEISDESMAEVSGQDGISATLGTNGAITTSIYLHDKDGLSGASGTGVSAYSFDGAIVIQNMTLLGATQTVIINIDAGASATSSGTPVLNVNVQLPATLTISTGSLHVANSQRDNALWSIDGMTTTIMTSMNIILSGTQLNIQLGNENQTGTMGGTDMMVLSASITSGLVINGFSLLDATSGGGMSASQITITNAGSTAALNLAIDGNISNAGLVLGLGTVGTGGMDIRIADQRLGTTTNSPIGDISIVGLNLNGATLTINGK